jgi:hypothetical protein
METRCGGIGGVPVLVPVPALVRSITTRILRGEKCVGWILDPRSRVLINDGVHEDAETLINYLYGCSGKQPSLHDHIAYPRERTTST